MGYFSLFLPFEVSGRSRGLSAIFFIYFYSFRMYYILVKVAHEIMGHFTLICNFWSRKDDHFIRKCQNLGGNYCSSFSYIL